MVRFTSREIRDIIISMLVIAVVFAYIFSNHHITFNIFLITLVAVGFGFVFHELMHKFVAIRYGYWAEYKMWVEGLILALVTAFAFGFVFAAPGAVYIHGTYIRDDENGKISLAGPVTNILLAFLFLMLFPLVSLPILKEICVLGLAVNSFLAFFNLIPFTVLDGAKVFRWNPFVWVITMGIALILIISSFGRILI